LIPREGLRKRTMVACFEEEDGGDTLRGWWWWRDSDYERHMNNLGKRMVVVRSKARIEDGRWRRHR
jgi:hypothetical protein